VQLVLDDDSGIPLPLDEPTRDAWLVQCGRAEIDGGIDRLRRRLAQCFATSLIECLDADLRPPSSAQLKYATDLARKLGVALPAEVIRYRGEAMEFIDRHAGALRARGESLPDP
jgi:hypothetical protein